MARVKIEFPNKFFEASFSIPVRITDINYGNHVGNDSLVSIIQEARMLFLQQYAFTELDISGTGLIMADLAIEFKNESFYKDIINVQLAAEITSKVSFDLYYKLTAVRDKEKVVIAHAKTGMVCFDYKMKKVITIPAELHEILQP